MAQPAYSQRLYGPVNVTGAYSTAFTVPVGLVYVVRQLDFQVSVSVAGGNAIAAADGTGIANRFFQFLMPNGSSVNREGRWVFETGSTLHVGVFGVTAGGTGSVMISGYILDA
jgi:hypothetical protein